MGEAPPDVTVVIVNYNAGDHLLRTIAERLRHVVRPDDTVARLGGDEFVVLCSDIADSADCGDLS